METLETQKNAENNENLYICSICDFSCSKKSNYTKHLATRKHHKMQNGNQKMPKNALLECVSCSKKYKTKSGLWKHFQKCKLNKLNKLNELIKLNELNKLNKKEFDIKNYGENDDSKILNGTPLMQIIEENNKNIEESIKLFEKIQNSELSNKLNNKVNNKLNNKLNNKSKSENTENTENTESYFYKDLVMKVLKQNDDLQSILNEQQKQHSKEIQEMIPKLGNVTNHNKFNMNIYLNEYCKDAVNISDFVHSLNIDADDLVNTGKNGFVKGITTIFVNGLEKLDESKRPIHCTDVKREILYVKDNDNWAKDANKEKIKMAIKHVSNKNMKQISTWVDDHPSCMDCEEYINIIMNSTCENKNAQEKYTDQIIKNIAKNVVIDEIANN